MKRLIFLSAILSLAAVVFTSDSVSGQNRQTLFSLKESPQAKSVPEKSSIASVRESEINFNSLSAGESTRLRFPLFDGKIYEANRVESETRTADDYTWRGKLVEGKFSGDVSLTFKKGFVSGLIYAPNAVYEIVPRGDKQILVELNQTLFPECAGNVKGDQTKNNRRTENALAGVDSGDKIDVLVLYTTPVKNSLGGDAQAQAFAQQAIDISNTTYLNSKIRQRLRLVNARETAIAETGSLGSELPVLRADTTGAALRDQYKADLVAMISNSSDNCGIGYLMGTAAGGNSNNAFTVTSRSCAVGNLSFPHELGHNMGSAHNPENGSGGTYPYSFGHWINGSYRTVMSYVDQCTSGCTRHPYFSNPSIVFMNAATGTELRDNARSINNTADSIANYRYSGTSLTLTGYNGGEWIPRYISRAVTWSSDNLTGNVKIEVSRDETTSWETLIASTANDGSEIINVPGRATRHARIRVSSIDNANVSDSSVNNILIK
ncbi:MAG: M12 family metallo-peptidase [Pyrinomonadaceae bacterium]